MSYKVFQVKMLIWTRDGAVESWYEQKWRKM